MSAKRWDDGFTLVEVLVVLAIIGILAGILLPALANSKAQAQGMFCLNNTRQLALGWVMYADDHNGRLAYNLAATVSGSRQRSGSAPMDLNWANNVEDWEVSNSDNTNAAKLVATGLGPYVNRAAAVYRCPADNVLSPPQRQAGWTSRVRSYSMNAMVGDAGDFTRTGSNTNNPGYIQFFTLTRIPQPSQIFVFLDEHPDSIDDGYFINQAYSLNWQDMPASFHNGAASLSFADGHGEAHSWRFASTKPPAQADAIDWTKRIPAAETGDYYWLLGHMSVEQVSTADSSYSY